MDSRSTMQELNSMLAKIEASYMTIAKENGLTYNELMMLYMIGYSDHLTQKQICDELYLPKSSVHSMLTHLSERGILSLTEGGNKKEKYVVATIEGEVFLKKVLGETEQIEDRTLASLPDRDIAKVMKIGQQFTKQLSLATENLYGSKQNGK